MMKILCKITFGLCFILMIASFALAGTMPFLALLNIISAGGLAWNCAKEIKQIEAEEREKNK